MKGDWTQRNLYLLIFTKTKAYKHLSLRCRNILLPAPLLIKKTLQAEMESDTITENKMSCYTAELLFAMLCFCSSLKTWKTTTVQQEKKESKTRLLNLIVLIYWLPGNHCFVFTKDLNVANNTFSHTSQRINAIINVSSLMHLRKQENGEPSDRQQRFNAKHDEIKSCVCFLSVFLSKY